MALWLIALIGIILAAWWYYTRRLDWQFARVVSRLNQLTDERRQKTTANKRLMRRIYKIINASLNAGTADNVYQAFDLLKLALGYGLGRPGEPVRITSAVYLALRLKQFDAAGHGIDAFRPLIKNMTTAELPTAVEQLSLIAVISLKQRQNFLAARAVEIIAVGAGAAQDDASRAAVMRAFRLIGLIALRRNDPGLIREIQAKMAAWLAAESLTFAVHEQVAGILTAWLHRVVRTGDINMFEIVTQYIKQLVEKRALKDQAVASIITECNHIAGMDSLNPYSQLAGEVSMLSLELAAQVRLDSIWRQAIDGTAQAARLAVAQRTLMESFAVVYPLFEMGRRLLTAELNASSLSDTFRQQALYVLMRECLQMVEYVARQNFTTTAADIIDQIYNDWIKRQTNIGQHKSIKKFCQFLFLYCTRVKRRQKRLTADEASFYDGAVITSANRERLKNLGYLL